MGVADMRTAEMRTADVADVPSSSAPAPLEFVPAGPSGSRRNQRSRLLPRSARARMMTLFLGLLVIAGALSIIGIRTVMAARVERRTAEALEQEVEEVQLLISQGIDPATGRPFASLDRALDVYFERNVPSVQEAHVAFVDDALYRSRLRSFPGNVLPDAAVAEWREFARSGEPAASGDFHTSRGDAQYRAVRITIGAQSGAFVVAILPEAELREIRDLQTYGTLVVLVVVVFAGLCVWALMDRMLGPVRELTDTARSISEVDRGARVRVNGGIEAAEMARNFNAMLDRLDAVHYSQLAFLEAVGHELRTPLTVATGHLELIDDDDPGRRAAIDLVIGELARMARLVDDLQTLAESEREDYIVAAPIDIEQFARSLLMKSVVLGDRRWQLDELGGGTFEGDAERLTEAMLNLVDNAVNHTEPGDEIGIGAVVDKGEVRLWVRDTGPGVDPADDRDLFERFVRGRAADQRYRGSGLGLTITRSIARAHGGDVTLERSSGMGACFTIRIPHGVAP
jgi:signal transduction histidine kinase